MSCYTQEQKAYLLSFKDSGLSYTEIAKLFNEKFNENKTRYSIKEHCRNQLNFGKRRNTPHTYTEEEMTFLKENKNLPFKILTRLFNEKFKTNLTHNCINLICSKNKIKNGNHDKLPIGTIIEINGREKIIVSNKPSRCYYYRCVDKSKYIYEQAFGKIPPGCSIIHLDGNYKNYDLNNLYCVSKSMLVQINKLKLYGKDKITEAMLEIIKAKQVLKDLKENKRC